MIFWLKIRLLEATKRMKPCNSVRHLTARILLVFLPVMATWAAETHLVPLTELRQRTVSASDERQASVSKLDRFFATDAARQALQSVKLDGGQVHHAVALLNS